MPVSVFICVGKRVTGRYAMFVVHYTQPPGPVSLPWHPVTNYPIFVDVTLNTN